MKLFVTLVVLTLSLFPNTLPSETGRSAVYAHFEKLEIEARKEMERKMPLGLTILSSVPRGAPIDLEDVKCRLGVCSGFGPRFHPIDKKWKKHTGADLPAKSGTEVYSTVYGTVWKIKRSLKGYGKQVWLKSDQYKVLYAHLSKIKVEEGQRVEVGMSIGEVGSTGVSTGPHLHYEVRVNDDPKDPVPFIKGLVPE